MQNDHETLSKEKGEHKTQIMITANQIYTNASQTDNYHNGQTLTLKTDHTFHLDSQNHAFDSRFQEQWDWNSSFYIDGIWSYDKELKIITLTATKFSAKFYQPLKDQQSVLAKGFPNRVVSTSNFSLQQSKEIKCFVVNWNYDAFKCVYQGTLKRI